MRVVGRMIPTDAFVLSGRYLSYTECGVLFVRLSP